LVDVIDDILEKIVVAIYQRRLFSKAKSVLRNVKGIFYYRWVGW